MSTNPEVWISPEGEEVALNCLGDKGFDDWYPEEPGQRHPMRYAMVNEAGQDVYAFTVFPLEPWSPYDAASDHLAALGYVMRDEPVFETCEHGMDANLCAGPGHYPMDY